MKEETTKLIEQMAQQLGTTTEYLWSVLIKQAPIDATVTLFQFVIIGVFGYMLFRIHKKLSLTKEYDGYNRTGYCHYEELAVIPMLFAMVIFAIVVLCAFFAIPEVIYGFFNPEYWALQQVIKLIN